MAVPGIPVELSCRLLLTTLALATLICGAYSQEDADLTRLCNAQSVCGRCIRASPLCSWCADLSFPGNARRCYPTSDTSVNCTNQQNPRSGIGNKDELPLEGINQISLATIDVRVRPGQPVTFPLSIRPARNVPVDVYLLMDLSFSMFNDLQNLKTLAVSLADAIGNISSNYTIGFGSFVEKPLGPYTSLNPAEQNNPCAGRTEFDRCVPTYSYKHVISLTPDATFFSERVQAQIVSGNRDEPEGGFDGFLQSIVCTDLIGWRAESPRKMIVYITDAGFHYANDGKLGGVILPNDGRCRMDRPSTPNTDVDYNDWDVYDYPSIGQIAEALRRNNIFPIFAAEANAKPIYDKLANELASNGAVTGTLDRDSGNVISLVRQSYNNISQRIQFYAQPISGVSFNFTPTVCPGSVSADGTCNGVQIEQTAEFEVSINVLECNAENSGKTIDIPVTVLAFGTFTVRLTATCNCDCEENPEVNSVACSGHGNLTCSVCVCNEGRLGDTCQCNATNAEDVGLMCPLGPTGVQCTSSDRGTCVCGKCECKPNAQGEPEYSGVACECDYSKCGRVDGQLCSGRGDCECDGCRCYLEPITGKPYINGDEGACECTPVTNCNDPRNETAICNGRGECGCDGMCQCNSPYFGTYCERCSGSSECPENCEVNSLCVQCALDAIEPHASTLSEEEFFSEELLMREGIPPGSRLALNGDVHQLILPPTYMFCDRVMKDPSRCPTIVIINATSDVDYRIDGTDAVRCESEIGPCTFHYFVAADSSRNLSQNSSGFLDLHVEFFRICAEPPAVVQPWVIAIAIIIPLLFLALLALILIKVLLLIFDAIEVKKFDKELANAKTSQTDNPLYHSAAKDYDNPLYGTEQK